MIQNHHQFKPLNLNLCPMPEKKIPFCDFLLRLTKSALILCILLSISLIIFTAFTRPVKPNPHRWFSFQTTTTSLASCHLTLSDPDPGPTRISHLLFGLGGSAKTWTDRRKYSELWWVPNVTRGFIWLDEEPKIANFTWPETSPPYRVSGRTRWLGPAQKPSDRIARILKESFELGLPGVRWFVMGDDDTVFFADNLVSVLARYDHRQMYYVGGASESVEQNVMHSYDTAFGGGGFAVSYPLACELFRNLDGCIERYRNFYGSDEKVSACVGDLGVPLTREPGFHQIDIRGDPYGLLAAHPVAPLVSLHHLDYVKPLFPNQNQVDSLKRLMRAYRIDPGHTLQQSFCYDRNRKWSVSISWGYSAQLYPSLVPSRVLGKPLRTFRTWRSWSDGPFLFNTRPFNSDPCEKPIIFYLDQVEEAGEGKTFTTYSRVAAAEAGKKCNQFAYKYAMSVGKITVVASNTGPEKWMKAPRRQCCEITNSRNWKGTMRVKIRSCKPKESTTI